MATGVLGGDCHCLRMTTKMMTMTMRMTTMAMRITTMTMIMASGRCSWI